MVIEGELKNLHYVSEYFGNYYIAGTNSLPNYIY